MQLVLLFNVASSSKLQASVCMQPVHVLLVPLQIPQKSLMWFPPQMPLQSTGSTHTPKQSKWSLANEQLPEGSSAFESKLHPVESMQPVQDELSPLHTPQKSNVDGPPHTPAQSLSEIHLPAQLKCSSAYVQESSSTNALLS